MERDDAPVHLRADRAVPDVGVDGVGEIDRRRAGGQRLHLALGREDEDLLLEELLLRGAPELARVVLVGVDVHQLLDPLRPALVHLPAAAALVHPVRGDAVLGLDVHLTRPQLDLERDPVGPDHGRVQRAVAVQLRHRDVVLEAAGHRLPERVDQAERAVAVARALVARALDDHAHGREVVDLVELAALLGHLVVDRVEVLRAPGDVDRDADLLELELQDRRRVVDAPAALGAALVHHRLDLGVLARVQPLEREVLELPLERVDAEPVSERRVDLERLLRLLDLLLLAEVLDRPHVVQAVGELDQDHPLVLGHRQDHLPVVLGLGLLAALEADPRQLRHALDEARDLVAELGPDVCEVGLRVLDHVVQQRGRERLVVEVELGADLRRAPRVVDERLAGTPLLAVVRVRRVQERLRQQVAVDVGVVRLDVGDQLVDQALVALRGARRGHGSQCTPGLRAQNCAEWRICKAGARVRRSNR